MLRPKRNHSLKDRSGQACWLIALIALVLAGICGDARVQAQGAGERVRALESQQRGLQATVRQEESDRGKLLTQLNELVSQQADLERQATLLQQELKKPLSPSQNFAKKCTLQDVRQKQATNLKQASQVREQLTLNQNRLDQVRQQLAQVSQRMSGIGRQQAQQQTQQQLAQQQLQQQQRQQQLQEQMQQEQIRTQSAQIDQFMTASVNPLGGFPVAVALGIGLGGSPVPPPPSGVTRFLASIPMYQSGTHWRSGTPINEQIPFLPVNYTELQLGKMITITFDYQFDVPPTSPAFAFEVQVYDNPFTTANTGGTSMGPSPASGTVTIPLTWVVGNQDLFITNMVDPALLSFYAWNANPTTMCAITNVTLRFNQ